MALPFTLAVLLAAALLFTLQPMAAKMLLPQVGGTPALWNTCMVFFQVALLAGYGYAHLLARTLKPRAQLAVHGLVLLLPLFVLPVDLGAGAAPERDSSPVRWVLATLATGAGLPFLVVATSGPLLQRWFSRTAHAGASDPYFLYAASNAGSLGGLLLYPLVLEPFLPLTAAGHAAFAPSQSTLWAAGYLAFALVALGSGLGALWRAPASAGSTPTEPAPPVSARERLRWLWLAFVPSSALLATTAYVTSDIGAIPLLWVVPLSIYLLSFVLVFSKHFRFHRHAWGFVLALSVTAVAVSSLLMLRTRGLLLVPLHFVTLGAVAMVCHGRLARERPHAARLTEFYLFVALGGALGGVFNALVAPVIFSGTAEYPLTLFFACLLRARFKREIVSARPRLAALFDLAFPVLVALSVWAFRRFEADSAVAWFPTAAAVVPGLLCLAAVGRRRRFALAAGVLLAAGYWLGSDPGALMRERTFFGVHRVVQFSGATVEIEDAQGGHEEALQKFNVLIHGTTRHGSQDTLLSRRAIPTSYFHRSGPIGQLFELYSTAGRLGQVAVVGLGAGTLAAYGEPGMHLTFYEIDPAVVRIASDREYFTYLSDTRAELRIVTGDGRLGLAEAVDGTFDLIVLDAFSSDAVPVHLLTREAVALYRAKLAPGGAIALHLTNWFMRLEPVVTAVASDLDMMGFIRWDGVSGPEQARDGKENSLWAVLANKTSPVGVLGQDARWSRLSGGALPPPDPRFLWTDDYSNVVRVINWR